MSKRLLTLALTICAGSLVACDQLPEFPTVETRLVDQKNAKIHRYHLPKQRGEKAPYLGSLPLTFGAINKSYCFAPSEYSKVEQYLSSLEDLARERCK